MIISFGWTTPAILGCRDHLVPLARCGCPPSRVAKTCTRRDWDHGYATRFYDGQIVDAWNTSPRNVKGHPRKIATIRLTAKPSLEPARIAPGTDWEAEGFAYLTANAIKVNGRTPAAMWRSWRINNPLLYVVRFEVLELC